MKKLIRNNEGQVTIEFIFTFSFSVIFLVFFLHFAFNYTIGYIAHYATYSASRAYLSHDIATRSPAMSLGRAREYAMREFGNYPLNKFGIKTRQGLRFNDPDGQTIYEYVGAFFSFSPPFSRQGDDGENLEFLSESFLGREPTRAECGCEILSRMEGFSCQGRNYNFDAIDEVTVYDNGC